MYGWRFAVLSCSFINAANDKRFVMQTNSINTLSCRKVGTGYHASNSGLFIIISSQVFSADEIKTLCLLQRSDTMVLGWQKTGSYLQKKINRPIPLR